MVCSPKGLFEVERADAHATAAETLEASIGAVEAWAFGILKDAGIELKPGKALKLATAREHADAVHWALISIHQAERLRHSIGIAATKGEEAERQAIWAANGMWQFCSAAFFGKFVQNEEPLFKGIRFTVGPRQPRRDLLAELIDDALEKIGRDAKPMQVLGHIKKNAAVQDIDPDDSTISWRDRRDAEKTTTFKAFQNRVSARRKLFSK